MMSPALKTLLIIAFLIAIIWNLGAGLYYMLTDKGQSKRTVNALTKRIALSVALILLLDQFPRNCFRDTPRMFASDALAVAAAEIGRFLFGDCAGDCEAGNAPLGIGDRYGDQPAS